MEKIAAGKDPSIKKVGTDLRPKFNCLKTQRNGKDEDRRQGRRRDWKVLGRLGRCCDGFLLRFHAPVRKRQEG